MNWQDELLKIGTWFKGLIAAAIASAAGGVAVIVVDPKVFNFAEGWPALKAALIAFGLIGAAGYLVKSPLWNEVGK